MKKAVLVTLFAVALTLLCSAAMYAQSTMKPTEEAVQNLKPYPTTVDSLQRYVIYLEPKENENLFEVEIIPGKNMEVDCNNHRLMGSFIEEVVQGWGYNYYKFETEGQVISTMMMCMEPKTMKFVSGQSELIRYNSRLPIVVYLPKDMELKYRIWTAGEEVTATQE